MGFGVGCDILISPLYTPFFARPKTLIVSLSKSHPTLCNARASGGWGGGGGGGKCGVWGGVRYLNFTAVHTFLCSTVSFVI